MSVIKVDDHPKSALVAGGIPINGVDLVCLQHEYGVLGGTAGSYKLLLEARRGAWWVAKKTGLSSPPIETAQGWLVIYRGMRQILGWLEQRG